MIRREPQDTPPSVPPFLSPSVVTGIDSKSEDTTPPTPPSPKLAVITTEIEGKLRKDLRSSGQIQDDGTGPGPLRSQMNQGRRKIIDCEGQQANGTSRERKMGKGRTSSAIASQQHYKTSVRGLFVVQRVA